MTDRLDAAIAELAAALREEVAGTLTVDGPVALLSVEEAARRLGIGRSMTYGLIGSGRLRSAKVGRRRLIPADAVAELGTTGAS